VPRKRRNNNPSLGRLTYRVVIAHACYETLKFNGLIFSHKAKKDLENIWTYSFKEKKKGVRQLAPLSFTKKGFFEGGTSGLTPFFPLN
jgi:hypothetical protein